MLQAAVLALSLIAATPEGAKSYEEAFAAHEADGKPLVVLIGAEWCPACVTMKNNTLPKLFKRGKLANVHFATIDCDQERKLTGKLMEGTGTIPQLLFFHKKSGKWERRQLLGGRDSSTVEAFINQP